MGKKCRRKRLARAIDHFYNVEQQLGTPQGYDPKWLRDQVKAAVRMAKQVDRVLAVYEEDMAADIEAAIRKVMHADDQSVGPQGTPQAAQQVEGPGAAG